MNSVDSKNPTDVRSSSEVQSAALQALAQYGQICLWCTDGEDCDGGDACMETNMACVRACEDAVKYLETRGASSNGVSGRMDDWVSICGHCADLCSSHFTGPHVHAGGAVPCKEFRASCARVLSQLTGLHRSGSLSAAA